MKKSACSGSHKSAVRKTILIMKLSVFFLLLAMQISAVNYGQKYLNLKESNIALQDVLKKIENQSSFRFYYSNDVLPSQKLVSINVVNASLDNVMEKVLEGTGLHWKEINQNRVVITDAETKIRMVSLVKSINGSVMNENGEGLAGVSVTIKGAGTGAVTNESGAFTINANVGDMLVFSAVGFIEQEVKVPADGEIHIVMIRQVGQMDEVVVVGYGTTTRRATTSSVSTVDIGKVASIPAQSISDGLQGRASGIIMTSSSGAPGAKSQISIRGGGTPLYVIDGVIRSQNDFENINPNDIADFSVLKDAAATAVYGSIGANGAILVTTKKGVAGKPLINYSYNKIWSQPTIFPKKMGSFEKLSAINDVYKAEGSNPPTPDSILQYYNNQSKPFVYPNTDWQKVGLNSWAPEDRHDLSFATGTKLLTLYSSISYYDQGTILKTDNNYNRRLTYRINTVSNFDDIHLKVTTGLDGFIETNSIPNSSTAGNFSQIFSHIQNKPPTALAYNNFGLPSANTTDNPAIELSPLSGYNRGLSRVNNALLNLDYAAPFLKGLHFKFNGNYNYYASRNKSWNVTAPSYGNDSKVAIPGNPPSLGETRGEGSEMNLQGFITYNRKFGDHSIDVTGVYEQNKLKSSSISAARQRYQIIFDQFLAGPTVDQLANGGEAESARAGYIGRINYNFKNRYFIDFSGRYDANDFYPPNIRWGFFPSVSASYIISDEPFMERLKDLGIFNMLKLRGSIGTVGMTNADFGRFAWIPGYNINANAWVVNGQLVQGTSETGTLPSQNYSWYKVNSRDFGIDFSSLNNRLNGSWDYYYMRTIGYTGSDNSKYSTTLGIGLPPINIETKAYRRAGTDFSLSWNDRLGKDFTYKIGTNFTYFNALWENANEDSASLKNPYTRTSGTSGAFYGTGYYNLGFYGSNQVLLNGPRRISSTNTVGGDLKYEDTNGDGKIDGSDFRRIGSASFPRINFGINLDLGYKGVFFTSTLAGSGKRDRYLGDVIQGSSAQGILVYAFQKDYWTPANTNALYPRQVSSAGVNGSNNYVTSDFWLLQSGYVRLKFAQLGYDLKYSLLKQVSTFKHFKVFVSGTNLWTSAKSMKYFIDPESDTNNYGYPIQRTVSLGLNVGF
jgi:TonB-linked SusC/RagA family outer membrane protein